jgi:chromosome partitioning protein
MRTIAIANQKGGCGKTTTSINLSACLGGKGKRVLLIDLDPQGHSSIGFGIEGDRREKSVYEVMIESASLDDVIVAAAHNVDIAPSNVVLSAVEQQLSGAHGRERRLLNAIQQLQEYRYDFVIIDTPPSVGLLTFNALVACSEVIIPVDVGYFSLHGMAKLIETIEMIRERLDKPVHTRTLLTQYDRRSRVARDVLDRVRDDAENQTFGTSIRVNVALRESCGKGKPITEYNRRCNGFKDYDALADEVMAAEGLQLIEKAINEIMAPKCMSEGVVFSYQDSSASSIKLAGDFNDWEPDAHQMHFEQGQGVWTTVIPLKPGRYQYRFVVDGEWHHDPNNPNFEHDPYGGMNSVIDVPRVPVVEASP